MGRRQCVLVLAVTATAAVCLLSVAFFFNFSSARTGWRPNLPSSGLSIGGFELGFGRAGRPSGLSAYVDAEPKSGSQDGPISAVIVVSHCCGAGVDWIESAVPGVPSVVYSIDGSADESKFYYRTSPPGRVLAVLDAGSNTHNPGIRFTKPGKNNSNKDKLDPVWPNPLSLLAYIIDNYDSLPDVVVFIPAFGVGRAADDLVSDNPGHALARLNLAHVVDRGIVGFDCNVPVGCASPGSNDDPVAAKTALAVWSSVFPSSISRPESVSRIPGSQFAVSRARIQSLSRPDWIRIRSWLTSDHSVDSKDVTPAVAENVVSLAWSTLFSDRQSKKTSIPQCDDDAFSITCACSGFAVCFHNESDFSLWTLNRKNRQTALSETVRLQGLLNELATKSTSRSKSKRGEDANTGSKAGGSDNPDKEKIITDLRDARTTAASLLSDLKIGTSRARERGLMAVWTGIIRAAVDKSNDENIASAKLKAKLKEWARAVAPSLGFNLTDEKLKMDDKDAPERRTLWPYYSLADM